ncbi:MAG: endonuclease MutS2, partial [Chloroflexi bacterium]|nr:endonuclease MutS2 [Chloroflexota bacterium]
MDEKSLEMIEFPKVRGMIAAHTSFSTSRDLALSLQPLVDRDAIALLLRQSAEARHLLSIRPGFSIAGVIDVRTMTHLASAGRVLTTADLANIQTTLAATRNLRTALSKLTEEVPS